ncbi:hypothetical protein [Enterococcus sp. LJL51]|uniref:hypothetical protein n=1 Tax=Enterococcus sp. LJL51 TaxID=3416656 RepID=UPI003CFAC8E1
MSTLIVFFILIRYFKSPKLKKSAYTMTVYLFTQNALVFYLSSLKVTGDTTVNKIVAFVYILVSYFLSFYVIRTKVFEVLQKKYVPENKVVLKKKAIENITRLTLILSVFIFVLIGFMAFFRFNKGWLNDHNPDFLSGLNNSLIGNVLSVLSIFIGLSILILVTLLPTLLLNIDITVDGLILTKYSEELREEYEFTREEWYGD